MPFKFSAHGIKDGLQIDVLRRVNAIQDWQPRYREARVNYYSFEKLCLEFHLRDFRKVRLALSLRNILNLAEAQDSARATPTLQVQLKTLKTLIKSVKPLARQGHLLRSKRDGAALRTLVINMSSKQLPSFEIETWLRSAVIAKRKITSQIRYLENRIQEHGLPKGPIDRRNIQTRERKLAVHYLPGLYEKIMGDKFSIEQGIGGAAKDTPPVQFVLYAAKCIDYVDLSKFSLLQAHIRSKSPAVRKKTAQEKL